MGIKCDDKNVNYCTFISYIYTKILLGISFYFYELLICIM